MYKDILTVKRDKQIESSFEKTSIKNKKPLIFREILCPKTAKPLITGACSKCEYKKRYQRRHSLGLTLDTVICSYGEE
ncbi:MAG: hypothetical protein ACTSSH_04040 [Candidatus Heimdallarchaeota archaeon]